MNLQNMNFRYTVVLQQQPEKLKFEALMLMPGLSSVAFKSRDFVGYAECAKSCKNLIEDMMRDVNQAYDDPKFKIGTEVNPLYSNVDTISKDWEPGEIARIWLIDKATEGQPQVNAICRGSIVAVSKDQFSLN